MTGSGPSSVLAPQPGAAPVARMLMRQAAFETRLLLRNGEQLLLTAVIPVVLLVVLGTVPVIDTAPYSRVDFVVPGILALAIMSTSFTSLAIATGYERRYGVLRLLATTPLPRWALLLAKALTVLVVQAVQFVLVIGIGVIACVLIISFFRVGRDGTRISYSPVLQSELSLSASDDYFAVVRSLGTPANDQ